LLSFVLFAAVAGMQYAALTSKSVASSLSESLQQPPWSDPNFLPIAVWLQSPANAERYRAAGINTYVALYRGPTEDQVAALKNAGMRVVASQNQAGLRYKDDPMIIAWMHGDEPDNAQSQGEGKGWGPPIAPEKIVEDYKRIRATDPSRPVLLNLGQGVAWDGWYGRGVRSNHPEDYPKYIEGCDIVSFDIYPAVHDKPEVAGKLWYVARGVERLVQWSGGRKVVWNCLECTRISNTDRKPTPHEVKAEAWMSLIHGSRGLIYFVHQFNPVFREAALLDDPEMVTAVTALNRQIAALAPVLNSPPLQGKARVESASPQVPVAFTVRQQGGTNYLFTVGMRDGSTTASFRIEGAGNSTVEAIGENRTISLRDGTFEDSFGPWDVHLYRWPTR
jgi:hypothetical protein